MKLFNASVLAVLLSFGAPVAAQVVITDRFVVNVNTNNRGGCAYVGLTRLNRMINDCVTLADHGIMALDDYNDDARPEARRIVDAFFKPQSDAHRTEIRSRFSRVRNWILNGGPVDNGENRRQPYLVCYHDWQERREMTHLARDLQGEPVRGRNGRPLQIRQIPRYVTAQRETADELGVRPSEIFPYWSLLYNFYNFDEGYGSPTSGYCSVEDHEGYTELAPAPIITLCPRAFGASSRTDSAWEYRGLHAVDVTPVARSTVENGNLNADAQRIDAIEPGASALFHELFHLVLGTDDGQTTAPNFPDEVYRVSTCLTMGYEDAVCNPENFNNVAQAYDYTRNIPAEGNDRIEFFSGFATRG
ncbi:hypothetical protein B0I35DRAFT_412526 [Stachybotrys elegans]|uniref:Lysine-specific metallo-endopeptidase domain-containing protein n=1 Tax=Stachybotrys elegans TaxID=80388 RepID=A0A8K0WMI9_9HYPO|nr:hypothetical protein B0I35DRAFT_412526 [Stachybotrys elegans]